MFKREKKSRKKNRYTIQEVAKNDALTCDNIERKRKGEASSATIIIVRTKEDKEKSRRSNEKKKTPRQ
jgi:hypothetical protein